MSDPVSALSGRSFEGHVSVRDAGPRGMIQLKGHLAAKAIKTACAEVTGLDFPDVRAANCAGETGLCWMAPDEVLILLPRSDVQTALGMIAKALKDTHHLAADVSDARAVIELSGAGVREVLARLSPANLRSDALQPGELRRTRLAQVPAAFWLTDETTAELICFRSVAVYVFDILANAAVSAPVGHLR